MKDLGEYYKRMFELKPHPEGGDYAVFYASKDSVKTLHPRYGSGDVYRPEGSSIYYMLQDHQFSAFHEVNSTEIWHYYDGNTPVCLLILEKDGSLTTRLLGNPRHTSGASFQVVIEATTIFAAELKNREELSFALVGCTVSPGFTFEDFKLNAREELIAKYPEHYEVVRRLTR